MDLRTGLAAATLAAALSLLAIAPPTAAATAADQPLRLVRVAASDVAPAAREFERRGFDVLDREGTSGVELVVSPSELQALEAEGFRPITLSIGHPLRGDESGRTVAVPAGFPWLEKIVDRLKTTEDRYPAICQSVDVTRYGQVQPTAEGRSIHALRISDHVTVEEGEPAVLIVAGLHPRETVPPVIALLVVEALTTGYGVDPEITSLVDENEIWIVPMANPDGYEHVFNTDNYWRKNRRVFTGGTGVDLNRNAPWDWGGECGGSPDPSSSSYQGPEAASESETQTLLALARDRRFAKTLDLHSMGQYVVHGFGCSPYPFDVYLEEVAVALSTRAGYGGDHRPAGASGELYQWHLGAGGALSFLVETHTSFQPSYASAYAEAERVWDGIRWFLGQPIPVQGRVTDAVTGAGVAATIRIAGVSFPGGDPHHSGGSFGGYHMFLPPGVYDLVVEADGYLTATVCGVVVIDGTSATVDVALEGGALLGTPGAQNETATLVVGSAGHMTYRIGASSDVLLQIFDIRGGLVHVLAKGPHTPGSYSLTWNGRTDAGARAGSGVYVARLRSGESWARAKLIWVD